MTIKCGSIGHHIKPMSTIRTSSRALSARTSKWFGRCYLQGKSSKRIHSGASCTLKPPSWPKQRQHATPPRPSWICRPTSTKMLKPFFWLRLAELNTCSRTSPTTSTKVGTAQPKEGAPQGTACQAQPRRPQLDPFPLGRVLSALQSSPSLEEPHSGAPRCPGD